MFEARQAKNDERDVDMVDACRRKRPISQGFHVTFALGAEEPLPWLPDVACGSVLVDQRGDSSYLEQFGDTARLLFIEAK
ncbi:hypothetical protein FHX42_000212 [Saccharopolyspora lacisalsi]|uniref:Uncharacterized protein n=1 Tax=Halosaccharopolyspora lacisalsi TaxID=1000566 RepID=A0A839DP99_9PSEU|nr:hypothetical protein [Halosaccharopolyspora lacisalsi]MBA8822883.1 hypothetical protein [Halosaccharopolyspora lacisalsi]